MARYPPPENAIPKVGTLLVLARKEETSKFSRLTRSNHDWRLCVAFVRRVEIYCDSRGESPFSPYRTKSVEGHVTFLGAYESPAVKDIILDRQINSTSNRSDMDTIVLRLVERK